VEADAIAKSLVGAGKGSNVEAAVLSAMAQAPAALHGEIVMAFFHRWRNTVPSARESSGVNEVRRVLERHFPRHWQFLK